MADIDPAETIRTYLLSLTDPGKLVDPALIAELEDAFESATDPLVKVKAHAALQRAKVPDTKRFEHDFIRYAGAWAAENDIPAESFAAMGVPEEILRAAGLLGGKTAPRKRATTRSAAPANTASSGSADAARQPSMTIGEVAAGVRAQMSGTFTYADVVRTVGGSPMTGRKAVEALIDEGAVLPLGPTQDWPGPGRAPLLFRIR